MKRFARLITLFIHSNVSCASGASDLVTIWDIGVVNPTLSRQMGWLLREQWETCNSDKTVSRRVPFHFPISEFQRRAITQCGVWSVRVVKVNVRLNRRFRLGKAAVFLQPDFLLLQRPEESLDVSVIIRVVVPRPLVVDLAGPHRLDEPSTRHLAAIVRSKRQTGTLNAAWETIIQRHIYSIQQVLRTAEPGKRVPHNLPVISVNHGKQISPSVFPTPHLRHVALEMLVGPGDRYLPSPFRS